MSEENLTITISKSAFIYLLIGWTLLCILIGTVVYRLSVPRTYIAHYSEDLSVPFEMPKAKIVK